MGQGVDGGSRPDLRANTGSHFNIGSRAGERFPNPGERRRTAASFRRKRGFEAASCNPRARRYDEPCARFFALLAAPRRGWGLRVKIVAITNLYPPYILGGYEVLCETTVKALAARGHETRVLTSRHGLIPGVKYPTEPGIRRVLELDHPFGEPGEASFKRRWELRSANGEACRKELQAFGPDVALVWSQDRLTLGPTSAAEALGIPAVWFLCDDHLTRFLAHPFSAHPVRLLEALAERAWRRELTVATAQLGHSLCISRSLRERLANAGIPVSHAQVYCPGIELERYPLKGNAGRLHRPPRLLYLGPVRPNKRVEVILRALSLLVEEGGAGLSLTVAGDGDEAYVQSLKRVAEDLGVARETLFMGRMPYESIPLVYRDHDIFVYASVWDEPFGLTHLEAMASGCPVVSTDCGGPTEYLRHEENALVVEKDSPRALTSAIGRLLHNAILRGNLVANARQMVEAKFSARQRLDELEAYLRKVAGAA